MKKKSEFWAHMWEWTCIYALAAMVVLVYVLDKVTDGRLFNWINNKLSK